MSRITVWIPLASLSGQTTAPPLKLLFEEGDRLVTPRPTWEHLQHHGLGSAAVQAEHLFQQLHPQPTRACYRTRPYIYLANPPTNLSNANGAALGILLGLLAYYHYLPLQQVMASGTITPSNEPLASPLHPGWPLTSQLQSARQLGLQSPPLPFILPYAAESEKEANQRYQQQLATLRQLNIQPLFSATLGQALDACQQTTN